MKKVFLTFVALFACVCLHAGDDDMRYAPSHSDDVCDDIRLDDDASYLGWTTYKTSFGYEDVFVRFPETPTVSVGSSLLTAFAYDYDVCYSFTGYCPPCCSIDHKSFFNSILQNANITPYCLREYTTYYVDGAWVLDYIMQDLYCDLVVKTRVVVTPYNAYTLQTSHPSYYYNSDHSYFVESFRILL